MNFCLALRLLLKISSDLIKQKILRLQLCQYARLFIKQFVVFTFRIQNYLLFIETAIDKPIEEKSIQEDADKHQQIGVQCIQASNRHRTWV